MTRHFAACLLAIGALGAVRAPGSPPRPTALAPEVTRHLSLELGSGPAGAGAATANLLLETDRWSEATLYAGDTDTQTLCPGGAHMAIPGRTSALPADARPLVVWKVEARLVSSDGDAASIDVRWRRMPRVPDLEPSTEHAGQFRWTTAEGASAVLDLVRQSNPAEARCESRSVVMRLMLAGAMELRDAAIGYDLWLVQRLPSGATRTHHVHTTGRQGEDVPFFFPQVGLEMPALAGAEITPVLDVGVQGRIRGRVRRDGRLDLSIDAGRWVQPRGVGLSSGTYGRTRLTAAPDETVEVEPPPHTGGWRTVTYDEVFRNARTAIRVRATRLW